MDKNEIEVIISLKDKISKEMKGIGAQVKRLGADFKNLAKAGIAVATVALIGLGVAMKKFVAQSAQFEKFRKQFEAFTGSAKEAEKVFDRVLKFASKTPFTVAQITQASTILQPLEQMGFTLEELLTASGNLAGSFDIDLAQSALNLSKAFASGIGSAELLRDRGVRTFIELKRGIDLTKVSQEELRTILMETFTEGSLSQGMAKLSVVYSGIASNLGDAVQLWQVSMGDVITQSPAFLGMLKTISGSINGMTDDIRSNNAEYLTLVDSWISGAIEAGRWMTKIFLGIAIQVKGVVTGIEALWRSLASNDKQLLLLVTRNKEKRAQLTAEIAKNNQAILDNDDALKQMISTLAQTDQSFDELIATWQKNKKEIVQSQADLEKLSEEMLNASKSAGALEKAVGASGDALDTHFQEWVKDTQDKAMTMQEIATRSLDGIADATANSLRRSLEEGESFTQAFKGMMRTMMFDIAEDLMRSGIREALGSILGSLGVGGQQAQGGSSGGGVGGFLANAGGNILSSIVGSFFHRGGDVGVGVPRFHDGGGFLRHDERQAILQTGERVLSRQEVSNGTGQATKQVVYNINAIDARSFADYIRENKEPIIEVINEDITRDGRTRTNIKRFGS